MRNWFCERSCNLTKVETWSVFEHGIRYLIFANYSFDNSSGLARCTDYIFCVPKRQAESNMVGLVVPVRIGNMYDRNYLWIGNDFVILILSFRLVVSTWWFPNDRNVFDLIQFHKGMTESKDLNKGLVSIEALQTCILFSESKEHSVEKES